MHLQSSSPVPVGNDLLGSRLSRYKRWRFKSGFSAESPRHCIRAPTGPPGGRQGLTCPGRNSVGPIQSTGERCRTRSGVVRSLASISVLVFSACPPPRTMRSRGGRWNTENARTFSTPSHTMTWSRCSWMRGYDSSRPSDPRVTSPRSMSMPVRFRRLMLSSC
jgi:hypothetical protein